MSSKTQRRDQDFDVPESAPPAPIALGTPEEHARATGNSHVADEVVAFGRAGERPQPGQHTVFTWQHNAAAMLHGWAEHAHHAGAPLQLTRADYLLALVAAENLDALPTPAPHRAALSPLKPLTK